VEIQFCLSLFHRKKFSINQKPSQKCPLSLLPTHKKTTTLLLPLFPKSYILAFAHTTENVTLAENADSQLSLGTAAFLS
jgi:hypothetical protein